jgi:hypothetical protein
VVFLFFLIPGIRAGVNYSKPDGANKSGKQAASIALACTGVLTLGIQFMMAPTHTIGGINYSDVWHIALTIIGVVLLMTSVATALFTRAVPLHRRATAETQ